MHGHCFLAVFVLQVWVLLPGCVCALYLGAGAVRRLRCCGAVPEAVQAQARQQRLHHHPPQQPGQCDAQELIKRKIMSQEGEKLF